MLGLGSRFDVGCRGDRGEGNKLGGRTNIANDSLRLISLGIWITIIAISIKIKSVR